MTKAHDKKNENMEEKEVPLRVHIPIASHFHSITISDSSFFWRNSISAFDSFLIAGDCFSMDGDLAPCSSIPFQQTRIPRRLRQRLLDCKTTSYTAEDIDAKLREADIRRQRFYEELSNKAKAKSRFSSLSSSSHEEIMSRRLEARLQAAEQKRVNILLKSQMRLSKLDRLRHAAKTDAQMRFEKERKELCTKVETRRLQAEENRMLIHKAYRQRRDAIKEKTYQYILCRISKERSYKECVRVAIHRKRAAAEKKRIGLLEAEKKRAHAQVLRVRRVANAVSRQREIERKRIKDKLEERLQRAKAQRAEYLRQKVRAHNSVNCADWIEDPKSADYYSRKIARSWRHFCNTLRTTLELTKEYNSLKINKDSIKLVPFDELAFFIESKDTLLTVKKFFDRLEHFFKLSKVFSTDIGPPSLVNMDHLLKRVTSPKKIVTRRNSDADHGSRKHSSISNTDKHDSKLQRYPERLVLCAYMIIGHHEAVFSNKDRHESSLMAEAEHFTRELELLTKIIVSGPMSYPDEESDSKAPRTVSFRSQLAAFDRAWCSYLNCFVVWKVKDARLLEDDLVKAACRLELSMLQICKVSPDADSRSPTLTHDMKEILKQVGEDKQLIKEKVLHLSGESGLQRMNSALADVRTKYSHSIETGTRFGSPCFLTKSSHVIRAPGSPSDSKCESYNNNKDNGTRSRAVRSLFQENVSHQKSSPANPSHFQHSSNSSSERFSQENEMIINEIVHEQSHTLADNYNEAISENEMNSLAKIRETMNTAFWDDIIDSLKHDEPQHDRVVGLVREVRDEICNIAPSSWKQEIVDAIDLTVLSQVLKSGNLDMDYLGRLMDFTFVVLRRLWAPSKDDEMEKSYSVLKNELAEICMFTDNSNLSHSLAMVKGLRFVLEQIRILKQDICAAHIKIMEPLLKGPAGLDYLQRAFTNRHGSPADAVASLPLTAQWLSSTSDYKCEEWSEHINYMSEFGDNNASQVPSTVLKTGVRFPFKEAGNLDTPLPPHNSGIQECECNGEEVDLLVRLGLLRLVTQISAVTLDSLPETLKLNLLRLHNIQARIQHVIVAATSILVYRQTIVGEKSEWNVSKFEEDLIRKLECGDDPGVDEIVEMMIKTEDKSTTKETMKMVLRRSLQDGDGVFNCVSRAVYLAVRAVLLGGKGMKGRRAAEAALRKVGGGASLLKVVEGTGEVLVRVSAVSVAVHGRWYVCLAENLHMK